MLPTRCKQYVADFKAASKSFAGFCEGDGPWDPKGFMVSKADQSLIPGET